MHQQQALAAGIQLDAMRPGLHPLHQTAVVAGARPRPLAERPEEGLLMIAEDRVRLALAQDLRHLVGEAVFPDAVAEADQLVDVAHQRDCPLEPGGVAVDVRNDAEFQKLGPIRAKAAILPCARLL